MFILIRGPPSYDDHTYFYSELLAHVNPLLNPLIYMLCNKQYRASIKELFTKSYCKSVRWWLGEKFYLTGKKKMTFITTVWVHLSRLHRSCYIGLKVQRPTRERPWARRSSKSRAEGEWLSKISSVHHVWLDKQSSHFPKHRHTQSSLWFSQLVLP